MAVIAERRRGDESDVAARAGERGIDLLRQIGPKEMIVGGEPQHRNARARAEDAERGDEFVGTAILAVLRGRHGRSETGSSSLGVTPTILPDGVRVQAQVLWGSIGWATPAAFGVALADPSRRTILITGEGSHQLTANDIGSMGRFGANVIVFVLNNSGYLIERALEENPNWTYNDLAPWNYAELPTALGCTDWFTARVTTLGELDEAMKSARASKFGAYIEIMGGKMDAAGSRLRPWPAQSHVRRYAITHTDRQKMARAAAPLAICEFNVR